jgi:hypothetical protein
MDKKLLTFFVVALAALAFVWVSSSTWADAPDEIVIENEGYAKDIKGGVKFNHKAHSENPEIQCTACHHVYDKDKKNTWKQGDPVQKCSECHKAVKEEGQKDLDLKRAYHANCQSCHKRTEEQSTGSPYGGYLKCNDCHMKKEKS